MFFLNLTAAEFFTLLGTLGSFIAALYLLDRARRRKVVSTLRFWTIETATDQRQARRKMREPWSLALQLVGLLLLLLAISHLQWGGRERQGRDHVLLIDTSAWAAARAADGPQGATVLARERAEARRYCALLPANDRMMLVAASSLATPLTRFTRNERELAAAIDNAASGYAVLNMQAAVAFARQAQSWSGHRPGEIAYTGPALTGGNETQAPQPDRMLPVTLDRVLPVAADRENRGIRQFTVEQADEPDTYRALVRIKNYGAQAHSVELDMRFAQSRFAPRKLTVAPGTESSAEYVFTARGAGELGVSLQSPDSLALDDRASLFIPQSNPVRVLIYTDRPDVLRPLLAADRQLLATFEPTTRYSAHAPADVLVLDRFAPTTPPALPALWIDPPQEHSPLPVKSTLGDTLVNWQGAALAQALHAKPMHIPSGRSYEVFEGDSVFASAPEGPVVVLRSGAERSSSSGDASRTSPPMAVVGFDPASGPLRFEVATPLLFASILQELNPLAFRARTFAAQPVGLVNLTLDREEQRSDVRVTGERGLVLPFTRHAADLQIFVQRPETVHIVSDERERVIDLRLPAVADHALQFAESAVGLPGVGRLAPVPFDPWKAFALAGTACLVLEWFLFGPSRKRRLAGRMPAPARASKRGDSRAEPREVVSK